ncbi:hypothetical protein CGZ98_13855 [Enemella evansiae]|uniref:FAD-dependent oxidoreductase n=1 Tax=Enemella evansiae TaxID=2016499 RepID=UPI000B96EA30|nr:FAD-dependent oxidoreductase [Enemella evansiae]OYO10165.1 hypothetical protein CGZ98_13855 [Enemella evansiae]
MSERVTVIGAGITGLTVGLLAARAGLRTEVVDPQLRPGQRTGLMGAPAGLQQELQYHHVLRWHGAGGLQAYADQVRRGQRFVLAAAADAGVPVRFADQATLTADGKEAFWLRHEVHAMRRAGVPAEFTDETGLPFSARPMLVTGDQPVLDPAAYRDGLLETFTEAGGVVEDRPRGGAGGWLVSTTPEPAFDRVLLGPRLRSSEWSWLELTSEDPGAFPGRSGTDLDDGGRLWIRTAEDRLLLGSRRDDGRARAASWFPDARVTDAWRARATASLDAAPFVGFAGRAAERRLVACGFDAWELTLGTAAALQLAAVLTGGGTGRAELPWAPIRVPRPLSLLGAGWSRARHGLKISPVSPFPRRR